MQELRHSPPEIWFRPHCLVELTNRQITRTVRLGMRDAEHVRGYAPKERARVRCRTEDGEDLYTCWVRIQRVAVTSMSEVRVADLRGSPKFEDDPDALQQVLARYYDRCIVPDDVVTIVEFTYEEDMRMPHRTLVDCIDAGILRIARQPYGQPQVVSGTAQDALRAMSTAGGTVPLIAHEYPAYTPLLWNAAYRGFGLPYVSVMVTGDPARIPEVLDAFRNDPWYLGGGAGVGFKQAVLSHLDTVDPLAAAMGAVNVIRRTLSGALEGYNTDGEGFAVSLEQALRVTGRSIRGATVVVLGAGGAGDAIAFALAARGAQLRICNRTVVRAEELARRITSFVRGTHPEYDDAAVIAASETALHELVADADAVVNTTSKGNGEMIAYSALGPVTLPPSPTGIAENHAYALQVLARCRPNTVIADIVLAHEETIMLQQARTLGLPVLDGIPMVVEQAIDAFRIVHERFVRARGVARPQIAEYMWIAARSHMIPAT
ncbi:hypothetical protein HYV74_02685 [Candidatus Uhrbacteria bacterium]|nr:hypothetical protein [Candidatus Uhrbacteria bacterium]